MFLDELNDTTETPYLDPLRKKCSYRVISGPYFPVFGLNTE